MQGKPLRSKPFRKLEFGEQVSCYGKSNKMSPGKPNKLQDKLSWMTKFQTSRWTQNAIDALKNDIGMVMLPDTFGEVVMSLMVLL